VVRRSRKPENSTENKFEPTAFPRFSSPVFHFSRGPAVTAGFYRFCFDTVGKYKARVDRPGEGTTMPLGAEAEKLIRANFETIKNGERARPVIIGNLSAVQLAAVNASRKKRNLPEMTSGIVFVGSHVYDSRIKRDGYTVEDVFDQISSALDEKSVFKDGRMAALMNQTPREDRYGNKVRDAAILECTARFPCPELFSVVPNGDKIRPAGLEQKEKSRAVAALGT
jgi:hypothetical protein